MTREKWWRRRESNPVQPDSATRRDRSKTPGKQGSSAFGHHDSDALSTHLEPASSTCASTAQAQPAASAMVPRAVTRARGRERAKWKTGRGATQRADGFNRSEYQALADAAQRCHNPKHRAFSSYGGRGIWVADEWRGRGGFARFIAHIGPKPLPGLSLDRINNDGGYEPGNVRWADAKVQRQNQRGEA